MVSRKNAAILAAVVASCAIALPTSAGTSLFEIVEEETWEYATSGGKQKKFRYRVVEKAVTYREVRGHFTNMPFDVFKKVNGREVEPDASLDDMAKPGVAYAIEFKELAAPR